MLERTEIKKYFLKRGYVCLIAGAQRYEDVLAEALSVAKGEHADELLKYLENKVNEHLEVPFGTIKLEPQIELKVNFVNLEMNGKKIELSTFDTWEKVLERWKSVSAIPVPTTPTVTPATTSSAKKKPTAIRSTGSIISVGSTGKMAEDVKTSAHTFFKGTDVRVTDIYDTGVACYGILISLEDDSGRQICDCRISDVQWD